MESRMSTEGARLRQSHWGESTFYIPCTVKCFLRTNLILTILIYEPLSPLPPVPRKGHFTKQETGVERLRIFSRVGAKWWSQVLVRPVCVRNFTLYKS